MVILEETKEPEDEFIHEATTRWSALLDSGTPLRDVGYVAFKECKKEFGDESVAFSYAASFVEIKSFIKGLDMAKQNKKG